MDNDIIIFIFWLLSFIIWRLSVGHWLMYQYLFLWKNQRLTLSHIRE